MWRVSGFLDGRPIVAAADGHVPGIVDALEEHGRPAAGRLEGVEALIG